MWQKRLNAYALIDGDSKYLSFIDVNTEIVHYKREVIGQKNAVKEELASAKIYNTTLLEMYNDLKARWNAIWQEPEMIDAWRRVEVRKKEDAKEKARQEAEAKRESMARQISALNDTAYCTVMGPNPPKSANHSIGQA